MQQAVTGGIMNPSNLKGKAKRVASSQLVVKQENYKKQEKQFDAIMRCQAQASKLAHTYIAAFGTDLLEEPVIDPLLDL